MTTTIRCLPALAITAFLLNLPVADAAPARVWTDPAAAAEEDPDFSIQGEYASKESSAGWGAQVVALGGGKFDVYLLEGGLPGLGWERGKQRRHVAASRGGDAVQGASADGRTSVTIRGGSLRVALNGKNAVLPKIERTSPTLGAKPPEGAVVLFDGSSADEWERGRVENGLLAATSCLSKRKFRDFSLHIEFRTPYMPNARGQGRGNSGVYYGGRWETQILDSFGLEGLENECGGIYSVAPPRLNMCLPPLAWQTYDVDFIAARFDADGRRVGWPRITVRLNGVLIHEDLELGKDFTTAAPITGPLKDEPGPIYLQYHRNPVFFRNIWAVTK